MSLLSAAANDEDGDTIKQLREENKQLRLALLTANDTLVKVSQAGARHARAAECLRETVIRWAARAEQAEDMLEAIGAGGVGKLEQPQDEQPVAICECCENERPVIYAPQPKREPLTNSQINRLIADGKIPRSFNPYETARAIERAHGIGGEK